MTVQEIYEHYSIMPNLQLHQLRAGGVAKLLCDQYLTIRDPKSVVIACLFHDMGNILKSDLNVFPEFLEPEGRAYWEQVKQEYVEQYGANEHDATYAIVREIGLPEKIVSLIKGMGFSKVHDILKNGSTELMIVEYADQRVAPQGVVSLQERLEDGRMRYIARAGGGYGAQENTFQVNAAGVKKLEQQLFADLTITPQDITEEAVSAFFEEFRHYEIENK